MKDTGFLPKGKEKEYLAELAKKAFVYAPVEESGIVTFKVYDAAKELVLDKPANNPPKGVIFPQNELLFTYQYKSSEEDPKKRNIELNAAIDMPDTVIFGARPCDAKGFSIYDRVYLGDIPDPYYGERRKKTAIITLSCPKPSVGCFCVAVGGGPADTAGSDVLMTEIDKGYVLEALTDTGKSLLEYSIVEDGSSYKAAAKTQQEKVHNEVKNPFSGEGKPQISQELFNNEGFWEQTLERCLSCGACTYLCPTCYCFNITDEQKTFEGERVRTWDACMFHHFTLEASGHNPRPKKQMRFRNRVGHKFVYYPEKYDGVIACCGCGRCIRYCPVSIDISEVVSLLSEKKSEQQEKSA